MSKEKIKSKQTFPLETIKRLSIYLRNLKRLDDLGVVTTSSDKIIHISSITSVQFRKDLSYFGEFGKRGVGYNVKSLIEEIKNILGVDKEWSIVLVGVGRLGSALLGFKGFSRFNIKVTHAFDVSVDKVGKVRKGVKILDIKDLPRVVKENNLRIAIISTSPEVAQIVADSLVKSGILGILNFASRFLNVPSWVSVSNVDMACELESLIFFTKQNSLIKK